MYLFSECCRYFHKQNELEVKRGTEIPNTMVKVETNRQIEIYISNSRTHITSREGCVHELITVMSPRPHSTRAVWASTFMSPWPLSMRTVWAHHYDVIVISRWGFNLTPQWPHSMGTLWTHHCDVIVISRWGFTLMSQWPHTMKTLWAHHCDITVA